MTEPTASPDATELRQRLETNHDHIWLSPRCDDDRTWCQDDIGPCDDCGEPTIKYVRADIAEADLVALRQEVERLTRDLHSMTDLEELQAKSLDETDAELQAAEASLRLATQRREDAHEIAGRLREIVQKGMDHHPDYDTDRQIYGAMHMQVLRLLEWDVSARAALQPKEN